MSVLPPYPVDAICHPLANTIKLLQPRRLGGTTTSAAHERNAAKAKTAFTDLFITTPCYLPLIPMTL